MKIAIFLVSSIISFALSIQAYTIYLHFFRPEEVSQFVSITKQGESIAIGEVTNKVVIGQLAGNRNLAFGVKNILEEYIAETDYTLNPYAEKRIDVEILFLDVEMTKTNLSVFHQNKESVVIKLRGKLYNKDKVVKTVIVEESADEVSMSAVLIDEGGKFNQQNLSSALKKASNTLVSKLL